MQQPVFMTFIDTFSKVYGEITSIKTLRLLLWMAMNVRDDNKTICLPNQCRKDICNQCHMSQQTLIKSLHELENMNIIKKEGVGVYIFQTKLFEKVWLEA